jgi:hypothetical protein
VLKLAAHTVPSVGIRSCSKPWVKSTAAVALGFQGKGDWSSPAAAYSHSIPGCSRLCESHATNGSGAWGVILVAVQPGKVNSLKNS